MIKLLHCDLINSSIIEIKMEKKKLIKLDDYVQERTLEEQFIDIISNDAPKDKLQLLMDRKFWN